MILLAGGKLYIIRLLMRVKKLAVEFNIILPSYRPALAYTCMNAKIIAAAVVTGIHESTAGVIIFQLTIAQGGLVEQAAFHFIPQEPPHTGKVVMAAAVGAWTLRPGRNLLIIDAGSCITFDLVTADGAYQGGNISP